MKIHFSVSSLRSMICLVLCLLASASWAEWSEPVNLSEINYPTTAQFASLTADQLIISFIRDNFLMEARRDDPFGLFTEQRIVSELGNGQTSIRDSWISADGLRLYYAEIVSLGGQMQRVISMAIRENVIEQWVKIRTFHEIHINGIIDTSPALTSDELTMVWTSSRYVGAGVYTTYIATRPTKDDLFSNVIELSEVSAAFALRPHLSDDGLRIYFDAPNAESGILNIFIASRESLDAPFGNIELMDGICGPDLPAHRPWVSSDEKTIYFNSYRGDLSLDELGIWVSYWIDDPYDVFVESVEAAIAEKNEALVHAAEALAKEISALEALNDLRDVGEIDGVNILQAKMSILHAIHCQVKARLELKKGIKELEDSLKKLNGETKNKPSPKPRNGGRSPNGPKSPLIR